LSFKLIENRNKIEDKRKAKQQLAAQQQEMVNANTEAQTLATMKQAGI
jgi:hypothetical protein